MKIKEIEVSKGRTINMGNYESARVDVRMSAQLDSEDDPLDCMKQLRKEVDFQLEKEVRLIEVEMGVDDE